jgi:pimeloyl-ACP methyl ester carboxylesterase
VGVCNPFEAVVRDLDAVLEARGVERPLLVGWSCGALLGVHWAARNPGRVVGVVGVDGPYPVGWTDDAGHDRIRRLFRRLRWAMPLARLIGNAARMSSEQHADIAIEAHKLHAALTRSAEGRTSAVRFRGTALDRVRCPHPTVPGGNAGLDAGGREVRAQL